MPHRQQDPKDICSYCDEFAVMECRRCRSPLFLEHKVSDGEICSGCKEQLRQQRLLQQLVPQRQQATRDICAYCDEFAMMQCPRCLAPLCADHEVSRKQRCSKCEQDYEKTVELTRQKITARATRLRKGVVVSGAVGFATGAAMSIVGGVLAADGLLALGLTAVLLSPVFVWMMLSCLHARRVKLHLAREEEQPRARFLEERHPRALPVD